MAEDKIDEKKNGNDYGEMMRLKLIKRKDSSLKSKKRRAARKAAKKAKR